MVFAEARGVQCSANLRPQCSFLKWLGGMGVDPEEQTQESESGIQ